jgi:hypothetical protein
MKTQILIFGLILTFTSVFAQHEKVVLGEFCYYEMMDGQKSSSDGMPYTYHQRIELKFKSGYQITIKIEDKQNFIDIIKKYNTSTVTQKTSLGDYKPESIAGVPAVKGKYSEIIDTKATIGIFYDGKKLYLEIPELNDMFGSGTSPNHTIFISKECIGDLLTCLNK